MDGTPLFTGAEQVLIVAVVMGVAWLLYMAMTEW